MSYLFEEALRRECERDRDLALLQAQWEYDRRLVGDALATVGWTFPHYSRHDASHSSAILVQLARFLGPMRIARLSATDVWLLLEAAYQHDIGMVVTDEQARAWLKSEEFTMVLERLRRGEDSELARAAAVIAEHPDGRQLPPDWAINVRRALTLVLAEFGRQQHARNAERVIRDPTRTIGLLSPRTPLIPERLFRILGSICSHHGRSFDDTMLLPEREAGLGTDEAHPRFVACMLRLGDLLDLDNGRFCSVMMKGFGVLPPSSAAHLDKHAAIKHLEIGPTRIAVEAECESYEGYEVTEQWLTWLRDELKNQMARWAEIAPSTDFGALPSVGRISACLRGHLSLEPGRRPRFEVDREAIVTLAKGANIYEQPICCIRELMQNAVDASILRLWREEWSGLPKERLNQYKPTDLREQLRKWPIQVTFERAKASAIAQRTRWRVTVKDHGTGIALDEIRHIQHIGSSPENPRRQRDLVRMPEWMQPSGVFGIGLQSVFLFTDTIVLTTRHHETRDTLRITLRNGQGPGTDGITIQRLEGEDAARVDVGTRVEFEVEFASTTEGFSSLEPQVEDEPSAIMQAREIVRCFAESSVCHIELNGVAALSHPHGPESKAFSFFDRHTNLMLSIWTSFDEERVSLFYRGAPLKDFWKWDMLGGRCDVYFGRANGILRLSRDYPTDEGHRLITQRFADAMTRALPKYITDLRARVCAGHACPADIQAASLYAHLQAGLDPEVVGGEWRDARISDDSGGMSLGEIVSSPMVLLQETRQTHAKALPVRIVSRQPLLIERGTVSHAWGCLESLLFKSFPRCTYEGGEPWVGFFGKTGTYRFTRDMDASTLTDDGLLSILLLLRSSEHERLITMPCPRGCEALRYRRDAIFRSCGHVVARVWPRMVCPFVKEGHRIVFANLGSLVEWTAKNAEGGGRDEREVAQALLKFIAQADAIMVNHWEGVERGYDMEAAKTILARWLCNV